jgi:hypothetical protein
MRLSLIELLYNEAIINITCEEVVKIDLRYHECFDDLRTNGRKTDCLTNQK